MMTLFRVEGFKELYTVLWNGEQKVLFYTLEWDLDFSIQSWLGEVTPQIGGLRDIKSLANSKSGSLRQ